MEEILASIRRIIAEDQEAAEAQAPKRAASVRPKVMPSPMSAIMDDEASPLESVLVRSAAREQEVDEAPVVEVKAAIWQDQSLPEQDPDDIEPVVPVLSAGNIQHSQPLEARRSSFEAVRAERRPVASIPQALSSQSAAHEGPSPLLAQQAGEAISSSFDRLTQQVSDVKALTLDEMVKQMLRPMLKEWLDTNLPSIVEHMVQAEIERVSRRNGHKA